MTVKLNSATRKRFVVCVLLLWTLSMFAAVSREFAELDNLFATGKLNELSEAITTLKPNNMDDRAAMGFYNAALKQNSDEALKAYGNVAEGFPGSLYGQRSLLEIGKINYLERELETAVASLRRITSPDLTERFYWLAACAWGQDDYPTAIAQAENYLHQAPEGAYAEKTSYLLADCYVAQKKAYSAVSTLVKLQQQKTLDRDEQYLCYKLGYAYEMADKLVDAVAAYRQGYELDKYSQIAYQIEDRLFDLRSRSKSIDISFLYPYSLLQITLATEDSVSADKAKTPETAREDKNISSAPLPTPTLSNNFAPNAPVKIKGKPSSGYWLQAGRFSVEANANKLVVNIRLLKIPAVYYEESQNGKKSWVVLCGEFTGKTEAEVARQRLSEQQINSFITFY